MNPRLLLAAAALAAGLTGSEALAAPDCEVTGSGNGERLVRAAAEMSPVDPDDPRRGRKLDIGGNVTDLVRIVNHTDCPVTLSNWERAWEIIEVPPRGTYSGSMWVPWSDQPGGKRIGIHVGPGVLSLWQRQGYLYFDTGVDQASTPETFKRARHAPGLALEGGRRVLHIMAKDGRPVIKLAGAAK